MQSGLPNTCKNFYPFPLTLNPSCPFPTFLKPPLQHQSVLITRVPCAFHVPFYSLLCYTHLCEDALIFNYYYYIAKTFTKLDHVCAIEYSIFVEFRLRVLGRVSHEFCCCSQPGGNIPTHTGQGKIYCLIQAKVKIPPHTGQGKYTASYWSR